MCCCHWNHPDFFLMMSERRDGHLLASLVIEYFHLMFIISSHISLFTWCVLVFWGFVLFLKKTMPNSGLYIVMWVEYLGF